MNQISTVERRRQREYSAEFKTSVLEKCRRPGASLAGIALGYGINPNLVHRWMREDRQRLELIEPQCGLRHFCRCNCRQHRVLVQAQIWWQSPCNRPPIKALPLKAAQTPGPA